MLIRNGKDTLLDHGRLYGLDDADHSAYSVLGHDHDAFYQKITQTILTSNGTYVGETMTVVVDDASAVFGTPLFQAADFNYDRANATVIATMPAWVVALESGAGSKLVLVKGQLCNTAWSWSSGGIFVSTSVGAFIQTPPSGSAEIIHAIGWALSATAIYFDSSKVTLEIT